MRMGLVPAEICRNIQRITLPSLDCSHWQRIRFPASSVSLKGGVRRDEGTCFSKKAYFRSWSALAMVSFIAAAFACETTEIIRPTIAATIELERIEMFLSPGRWYPAALFTQDCASRLRLLAHWLFSL